MKMAFCLFNYFPYGGLQRDFLRIAKACLAKGHEIHVYTMKWEGDRENGIHIHLLPQSAWQNHSRIKAFASDCKKAITRLAPDIVVGFNKMPHLDVYYAADVCYQARIREKYGWFYRLIPRCRQLVQCERAVFEEGLPTNILLISALQQAAFQHYYHTEHHRFHMLPPGINKQTFKDEDKALISEKVRKQLALTDQDSMVLMVGSGFKTKGVDRSIKALASLSENVRFRSHLYVVGQDKARTFLSLAKKLGVEDRVHFLGARDDVPELMLAADLLIHPAYHENTGTVLLEALAAGLPVLTMDVCGYANYIVKAQAGKVLSSPFVQEHLTTSMEEMLISKQKKQWQQNALEFTRDADIYSMPSTAANLIEEFAEKKNAIFAS